MLASTRDESFGMAMDMMGGFKKPETNETKAIGAALIAGAIVLSFCLGWFAGRTSSSTQGQNQLNSESRTSGLHGRFGHMPAR